MNIAIIGGGFTGLTAAYELSKKGYKVTVFERDALLGGLAIGWKPARPASAGVAGGEKQWDWSLERAYHHLFTNDTAILSLVKELELQDKLIIKRPITANLLPTTPLSSPNTQNMSSPRRRGSSLKTWIPDQAHLADASSNQVGNDSNRMVQLDSPVNLLQFPGLSLIDKLRTGALAAFCKFYPFWQTLEGVTAKDFFIKWGGLAGWKMIWEPLMIGKFGDLAGTIAASWLWARVHKRTPSLCYIEGGFQTVVDALAQAIKKNGGEIYTSVDIQSINDVSRIAYTVSCKVQNNTQYPIHDTRYDRILLTTPTPIANRLMPGIASNEAFTIPHLSAQVLVLETEKPILQDIYWLSITDRSFPFLAVVAHTNFMDKKHYGGHHLTYIGNYLPHDHPYLKMTKEQLLKVFTPFISRLTHNTQYTIHNTHLFTAPFAQPVHQLHYSKRAPKLVTSIPGVYLANMDSIFPWDRGTNYAVELGQKAARAIANNEL